METITLVDLEWHVYALSFLDSSSLLLIHDYTNCPQYRCSAQTLTVLRKNNSLTLIQKYESKSENY